MIKEGKRHGVRFELSRMPFPSKERNPQSLDFYGTYCGEEGALRSVDVTHIRTQSRLDKLCRLLADRCAGCTLDFAGRVVLPNARHIDDFIFYRV